tara:strand:+ start:1596 stop:2357 length:762 start_codon:yes stop_codon:yes gene_type:complete
MVYQYRPIVGENYRYDVNSDKPFKISRSKIELFHNCPRCFYKEVKLGLRKPPMPGWAINSAVDALLKKEMDLCRNEDRSHGIFNENGLEHIKPFHHKDIEKWQNAFNGIQFSDKEHNFLIYGGVDDVMVDADGKLIVVDFKATAKTANIVSSADVYNNGRSYERQLEIYSWLLQKNDFEVSSTGYLLYYNGDASQPHLGKEMHFRRTIVPFDLDTKWIDPMIKDMHACLQSDKMPDHNPDCEECVYLKTVSEL